MRGISASRYPEVGRRSVANPSGSGGLPGTLLSDPPSMALLRIESTESAVISIDICVATHSWSSVPQTRVVVSP